MVTDIDHTTVQDKLVTVLQGNGAIFETPPEDANKFRSLVRGSPDLDKIQELPMPSLYVISDEREIDKYESEGPKTDGVVSKAKVTFIYDIVFVAQANTSARTEEKLNTFQKEIKETLQSNVRLGDVGAVTTNTVVHNSRILRVETLDPTVLGHQQQARMIVLELVKHIE